MLIRLLYQGHDCRTAGPVPAGRSEALSACHMEDVVRLMAGSDVALARCCREALLHPVASEAEAVYRADAVRDALAHPDAVRHLFALAQGEAVRSVAARPDIRFAELVQTAAQHRRALEELGRLVRTLQDEVRSEAFAGFCRGMQEAGEEYGARFDEALRDLLRPASALMGVTLRPADDAADVRMLVYPRHAEWLRWKVAPAVGTKDGRAQAMDRGALLAAAQESVRPALFDLVARLGIFFETLRDEAGFYAGCANLVSALEERGISWCLPEMSEGTDVSVAQLSLADADGVKQAAEAAEGRDVALWLVAGEAGSGKTALLRAWGQMSLMGTAGCPVIASRCRMPLWQEVQALFCGRDLAVEEEMARVAEHIRHLGAGGLLVWDEPFPQLSDKESAAILQDILGALAERGSVSVIATDSPRVAEANRARVGVCHLRCEHEGGTYRCVRGRRRGDRGLAEAFEEAFGEPLSSSASLGQR